MMSDILATILAAAGAFAATNIDDIFLLAVYFTQVNATFRNRHIVLGQYMGFAAILGVSALGYLGALIIPEAIIGLLGFAPIYMGIRRLMQRQPDQPEPETVSVPAESAPRTASIGAALFSPQTYSVALVTFANGGDNISVYLPLFAGKTAAELGITLAVFALLIALWCYLGYRLGNYPTLSQLIKRYGRIIVPFVLIALGLYILAESGTVTAFLDLFR
jgi:cadmium resistance transport/sequestration family protein